MKLPLETLLKTPNKKLGKSQILRKKRYKLWLENSHCHWCGKKTIWIDEAHKTKKHPELNLFATLDHLFSRSELFYRLKSIPGFKKHVLACFGCNQKRGKETEKKLLLKIKMFENDIDTFLVFG